MFVNEICVGLLTQCNWCCDYCIAYNNEKKIDESQIIKELYPIRSKLKKLWISGGEPGLLSENFWSNLLKYVDFNIKVCTNGTFISNNLYSKFEDRIDELMIHCVKDLDDDIDSKVLEVYRKNKNKISMNIVIHRKNVSKIKDFIERYEDINFDINFADRSFENFISGKYDYCIDKRSGIEIIKQIRHIKRYGSYIDRITKSIIKNDFSNLNSWSDKNNYIKGRKNANKCKKF